jgi:hypothetical protein
VEEANAFMSSLAFSENPFGVDFDPIDLQNKLRRGEDEKLLKKRLSIGPRSIDSIPLPPDLVIKENYDLVQGVSQI